MHIQQTRKQGAFLIPCTVLLMLLSGCSLMPQTTHHQTSPGEQPIIAPYQPYRLVQTCIDTPPLFPAAYFHQVTVALANRIDQAVTVNQGGMSVYVTLITHNSFQNDVLSFSVPAFPADPVAPAQPKQGENPYDNASTQQAYQQAVASWQKTLVTQHQKLAQLRAQVKEETDQLRTLKPPFDPIADDIYGCLDDATQHFQHSGEKYLIIASPLTNNTMVQQAPLALNGASVRVIWHTCTVASLCQQNERHWKTLLMQDGAKDVQFYDPAQEQASPVTF